MSINKILKKLKQINKKIHFDFWNLFLLCIRINSVDKYKTYILLTLAFKSFDAPFERGMKYGRDIKLFFARYNFGYFDNFVVQ